MHNKNAQSAANEAFNNLFVKINSTTKLISKDELCNIAMSILLKECGLEALYNSNIAKKTN